MGFDPTCNTLLTAVTVTTYRLNYDKTIYYLITFSGSKYQRRQL
jgi:hypothetical protein